MPFFCCDCRKSASDFVCKPHFIVNHSQRFGNSVVIPKPINIDAVIPFQKVGCISMSTVDALSMIENANTESAKDPMIIPIRLLLGCAAVLPSITGSTGSTQGARIVSIPDRKLVSIRGIR
jgi:hypothetical protein